MFVQVTFQQYNAGVYTYLISGDSRSDTIARLVHYLNQQRVIVGHVVERLDATNIHLVVHTDTNRYEDEIDRIVRAFLNS